MEKMPESHLLALLISNVKIGFSSPISALATLANHGYFFIGGVKHRQEHTPGYNRAHLDLNIGEWVYDVDNGSERTITVTDIGGIAILSGLFGSLDYSNERLNINKELTRKQPPHFAWKEVPRLGESYWPAKFDYYARPELITEAQLHPENVTGNVHIVKPPPLAIEPIGQGIYSCFSTLETLGSISLDGTALFNIDVEPDTFEGIESSFFWPKNKQG